MWAVIRPTTSPSRSQRKYSASAWSKNGFFERSRKRRRSETSGGTHCSESRCSSKGSLMKRVRSRRVFTGRTVSFPAVDCSLATLDTGPT